MSSAGGKYTLTDGCSWCGNRPAQEYVIEKRGVKAKRYAVTVMACAECARRMQLGDD